MEPTFDFGSFPVLETERLQLCEYDVKYVDDIFAIRGDPEVQLYNSEAHKTKEETIEFIEEEQEAFRMKRELIWALKLKETLCVVGCVSMFDWDRYHRRAQIGYDLAKSCWGIGLAQEAVGEVLRFGFMNMSLNRIEIWTSTANARSLRLAERLGFTRDGTLRKRILEDDGQFHDGTVYGLLQSEWLGTISSAKHHRPAKSG
ncbi:MAG: GNAT family N-acetyltransferase [Chlorobia bacterium]|nr:GNAT family N-acetyltransferase [Fimbriimonadaceae bacterium]